MHGKVIDEITVLTEDFFTIKARLNLIIDLDEPDPVPFKEEDVLKYLENNSSEWEELLDYFLTVDLELNNEATDILFATDRDAKEHVYLKKVEKFLVVTLHLGEDVEEIQLEALKKSCKSMEVRDFLSQMQDIVQEIASLQTYISELVQDSYVLAENPERFPRLIYYIGWLKASETGYESEEDSSILYPETVSTHTKNQTESGVKLQWSCNPATAGFIIATLVEKGYINPPFKGDGTTNDTELARVCLQLFEFDNASPSVDSMRRNLNLQSPNANQLSQDNRDMFKIPHRSRLVQSNASRNSPNT